jgi:adenylate kinase
MNIILIGAPGAGKGTLAATLKDKMGLLHISTGDLLRAEMKGNTDIGQEAKKYIDNGELVPDELVTRLIEKKLSSEECRSKGSLLDGYPRTEQQAKDLDAIVEKLGDKINCVLYLEASLPVVTQRLTGRRVCKQCGRLYHITNMPPKQDNLCDDCQVELYQRSDDNEETIKNRMNVYHQKTAPIIDYYKSQNKLHQLDADRAPEEVHSEAIKIIDE